MLPGPDCNCDVLLKSNSHNGKGFVGSNLLDTKSGIFMEQVASN